MYRKESLSVLSFYKKKYFENLFRLIMAEEEDEGIGIQLAIVENSDQEISIAIS